MTGPIAIGAGVVWTSAGLHWSARGGAPRDLVGALPEAVRARAERIERPGAVLLGAVGQLVPPRGDGTLHSDVGVSVGTALGCFVTNVAYQRRLAAQGAAGASPRLFAATVSNAAAGEAGIAFGLGGPAITLSAGAVSGLAALDAACGELADGGVRAMVVAGLDVADDAARQWLDEQGWGGDGPEEETAALVLGHEPADGAGPVGWLGGVALARVIDEAGEGVRAAAVAALASAGLARADVVVIVPPGRDARVVRDLLGDPVVAEPSDPGGPRRAAAGLGALLVGLVRERRPVLVVDAGAGGHVAAAVAWSAR